MSEDRAFLANNRTGKTSMCFAESLDALGLPPDQVQEIMDVLFGISDE